MHMKLKNHICRTAAELRDTLREIIYLLVHSWQAVLLFSLLYTGVYLFVVISLRDFALWANTRIMGITYVGPNNLQAFLTSPTALLTMPLLCIGLVFTMVFQIGGLSHAFSMAQIGKKPTFNGMVMAGAGVCVRYLNPRNWLIIPMLLVLMPLTSFMALSSSSICVVIPEFIQDAIYQNSAYSTMLLVLYLLMYLVMFAGIFAPLMFLLYDTPFNRAFRKSCRIARRHYWETLLSSMTVNAMLYIVATSIAAVLARAHSEFSAYMVDAGILTTAEDIGTKLYIISDLICAFAAPILNNALLTSLFFKYHEQQSRSIAELSPKAFNDRKANTALLTAVGCVLLVLCGYSVYRYGDTVKDIRSPSSRPAIVAHRGDSVRAPENTMPAFELALQEEPQWIELDVHQTKDGVIVVSHDDDLSRVARQKLYVHELTYDELRTYDVGSWFREEFSDVRLSTLDEVLKLYKDNIPVQIEIKPSGYDVDLEEHVLQVIYDNDMQDQVFITCLKPGPLKRIKELDPAIPTVYSMFFAWGHIEDMEFSDHFTIEESNVTKTLVDNVHKAGKKLFAWTVNSEENVQYLVDCGVDGILTDDPIMLRDALDKVDYSGGIVKAVRFITSWIAQGV